MFGPPQTVQLRQGENGYTGVADTYITRWYRTSQFGQDAWLFVRTEDKYGPTYETLVYFDLNGVVPENARVEQATLSVYVASRSRSSEMIVRAYRLLRPWAEDEATWDMASANEMWEQPGAFGAGDRAVEPVAETVFNGVYTWMDLDITEAVRAWVQDPSSNQGILLQGFRMPDGPQVQYRLASAQFPTISLRPVLRITYRVPTVSPTPTPTPTPLIYPTPTPVPTGTATPSADGWPGVNTPGIYMAYDYKGHDPATFGTVGSLVNFHWSQLENEKGVYTFDVIDNWLNKLAARGLKGAFFVDVFEGGCDGDRSLPAYIIASNRAVLRRNLGYTCPRSGRTWKAVPNYMDAYFQERYRLLIMRLGERYKNDPRVEFIAIGTGIYGETRAAADSADLNLLQSAGLTSEKWVEYVNKVTLWHYQAFSDENGRLLKPLLQQSAATTFSPTERKPISDYALSLGIGFSLNFMYPDGEGVVYMDHPVCPMCGRYDYPLLYWNRVPTAWEAYEHQTCTPELVWWGVYNVLNKHPVYLRVAARMIRTADDTPRTEFVEAFSWASRFMGVTARTSPSAWVALREHRDPWIPLTCLGNYSEAPHHNTQMGNYGFFMDQRDDIPGGRTVPETNDPRVRRMGNNTSPYNPNLPPGKEGWAVRRTDQATGNPYMFFDVDSDYLSGLRTVRIRVVYWDNGTDTWSLFYRNAQGEVVSAGTVRKQNTRAWKTATFDLTMMFDNSLPAGSGGADFYISSNNDGDEWIHFVEVIRQ